MVLLSAEPMPLVTAFGDEAERIARRCPSDASVLFCDGSHAAEALAEAVRRRREGDKFLVSPLLEDSLVKLTREAARSIMMQFQDFDQRRQLFEALSMGALHLNGAQITQQSIYSPQLLSTMREFSQLGDGLFVRSTTERTRLELLFGRRRSYVAVAPFIDITVPATLPNRDAAHVVVWAPNEAAENLCVFSYALWHLKLPAIFVCHGSLPDSPHYFVSPNDASSAIAQAEVIIDTQTSDPGTALAFAGRDIGIVTSLSTGAHEYIQPVATYYMHDFSTIHAAVTRARAKRRVFSIAKTDASFAIDSTIEAAQPVIPEDPPLVSVVISTFNRPRELRASLQAFAKQTYPNFEVIVVNDSGEDVSSVVAEFPFARYLCTPENMGCCATVNLGLHAAQGKFVAQIADDDRDYPTFITELASALLFSHVDVAHGNIIIRADTKLADGTKVTYGHLLDHDGDHDPVAARWGIILHQQGFMIRRDAYLRIGFNNADLPMASDVDVYAKLAKAYDFAHVTNVIGEMSYRDDKSNMSSAIGDGLPLWIETVLRSHESSDSQLVDQRIQQLVSGVAAAAQRHTFFVPWMRLETMIPVFEDVQ